MVRYIIRSKIPVLIVTFAVMLPFQNCGSPSHSSQTILSTMTPEQMRFQSAAKVLETKCASCHVSNGSAALAPFDLKNQNHFVSTGLVVPGNPDQSKLMARLRNSVDTSSVTRNMPPSAPLTPGEYETLRDWIWNMGTTTGPFTCNDNLPLEDRAMNSNIRRLSRRQYLNTLRDLLTRAFSSSASTQIVSSAIANITLPADDGSTFQRFDSSVIQQHVQSYFAISDRLATAVSDVTNAQTFVTGFINLNPGNCVSPNVASLSAACVNQFVMNFGLRALRRPVSTEAGSSNEQTIYIQTYNDAGGGRDGIGAVVFRMLLSPHFLYQIEDRETSVNTARTLFRLSSHSMVSRLSYMFWNSMPDEALFTRAATDLTDDTVYNETLTYVANSDKTADSIREFMYDWLKLSHVPQFSTTNPGLSYIANGITLDSSLRQAMIDEIGDLGDYIYRSNLTFNDLFSTDVSFARDSRLMNIYGVSTPAATTVTVANSVRFPANQRSGILSRAALLVAGSEIANPITRGIRVRREILCLKLDNPPAELTDALEPPPINTMATTRERFAQQTSPSSCVACHRYINALGFALGGYDAIGRFQTQEPTFNAQGNFSGTTLPVNTNVDLSEALSPGLSADSGRSLASLVANQQSTQACISEKYYRFAVGRIEDKEREGCRLNNMYRHVQSGNSLKDFMKAAAKDVEFRYRKLGQ